MRTLTIVVALLTLVSVANAGEEHPLGCWAGLVGGEWHAAGAWEAGWPFVARVQAEWGPAKSYLRVRTFIPVEGGEYLRYDSIYYAHPGKKKLAYLAASYDGTVATGTFTIGEDTVTFVYPGAGDDPRSVKSTWQFTDADTCRWTVWQEPAEQLP